MYLRKFLKFGLSWAEECVISVFILKWHGCHQSFFFWLPLKDTFISFIFCVACSPISNNFCVNNQFLWIFRIIQHNYILKKKDVWNKSRCTFIIECHFYFSGDWFLNVTLEIMKIRQYEKLDNGNASLITLYSYNFFIHFKIKHVSSSNFPEI